VVSDKVAGSNEAFAMAETIAAFDSELASSNLRAGDAEVVRAMRQIAAEQREEALDSLIRAIRIADTTSGGLDQMLLKNAARALDAGQHVIRSAPPASLLVRTEIRVAGKGPAEPAWALHYQTAAEFRNKEELWHSYNFGEPLRIGNYIFRATPGKPQAREYREKVLVLADPTVLMLQPDDGN
jgi:hypothetical protein